MTASSTASTILLWTFLVSSTNGEDHGASTPTSSPTIAYGSPGNIGNNFALATLFALMLILSFYMMNQRSSPLSFMYCVAAIFLSSVFIVGHVTKNWILSDSLFYGDYDGSGNQPLSFFGVLIQAVFFPLIFLSAGVLASHVFKRDDLHFLQKTSLFVMMETVFAVLAYISWDYETNNYGYAKNVLEYGVFGCFAKDYTTALKDEQDMAKMFQYQVVLGVVTFIFSVVTGTYVLSLLIRTVFPNTYKSAGQKSGFMSRTQEALLENQGTHQPNRASLVTPPSNVSQSYLVKAGTALLVLLGLFILVLTLGMIPPSWEVFSCKNLLEFAQGDSDNGNGVGKTSEPDHAPFKTMYLSMVTGSDEVSATTGEDSPGSTFTPGDLILKVYPDVLMFYLFLAVLTVGGFLAHTFTTVRDFFHFRLRLPDLSFLDSKAMAWWWTWVLAPPWTISIGAIFVLVSGAVFLTFFLVYWSIYHTFHGSENDYYSNTEIAARVVGQLANVWLGLMLFPVSKNSILTSAFGIAWEQVIYVHVWMGNAFMALCALHMFLWWGVYADLEILQNDILSVPQNFPCNGPCTPNNPHGDNWTISMMTVIVWAMFIFMGVFARNAVRRANFELFYYSHHFFLVIFIGVSWHASSAHYFLIGGAGLFIVDRCLRALNRARRWRVASITVCPDTITGLELEPLDDFMGRRSQFQYSCGQYLYLNIPEISPLEWHPFTISSAPSDRRVTCHIKQAPAGPSTFTGKLFQLAQNSDQDAKQPFTVNVDGPYGAWFDHTGYDIVTLVAGGIGVTPCMSIFRELLLQTLSGTIRPGTLEQVNLVWCIQKREGLEPFIDVLRAAKAESPAGQCVFNFEIFIDNDGDFGSIEHLGIPIKSGRPDCNSLISDLGGMVSEGKRPHVFACGPPGMVAMVNNACLTHKISFHKEVFAF